MRMMRRWSRSAVGSVAANAVELMRMRRLRAPAVERMRSVRRMVTTEVVDVVVLLLTTCGPRRSAGLVADGFIDGCRRAAGIRAEMIGILAP
jgi:hypothetical protein